MYTLLGFWSGHLFHNFRSRVYHPSLDTSHQQKVVLSGKGHIAKVAISLRTTRGRKGALTCAAMVGLCRNKWLATACYRRGLYGGGGAAVIWNLPGALSRRLRRRCLG